MTHHIFRLSLWRAIGFAAILAFAAGCETVPGAADAAAISKIGRVGVISAAGDKLSHNKVGFTVFGNDDGSFDIIDLGLDDVWEAKITGAVDALGTVETVNIDYDRAPFYASYPPEDEWPRQWRAINFEKTAPELQRLAQENNLDAIIVLSSDGWDIGRAGIILDGVSIMSEKGLIAPANSYYWFVMRLYLVDGATGAPIASRLIGKDDIFGPNPLAERAPEELLATWFSDYTDDDRAFLRERFIAMPEDFWADAVEKLMTPRN